MWIHILINEKYIPHAKEKVGKNLSHIFNCGFKKILVNPYCAAKEIKCLVRTSRYVSTFIDVCNESDSCLLREELGYCK